MQPTTTFDTPVSTSGYVPYFYESGRFQVYGIAKHPVRSVRRDSIEAAPFSAAKPSDVVVDSRFQTVEQIIASGYLPVPKSDPVVAAITDRRFTTGLGLDDVISQIRRRYEIHAQNVYQIERSKCAAMNAIYEHEAYVGPPSSKQTYAKHKAIQGLYEEERAERTSLWKDVSRLRTLMAESAHSYLGAYRKSSILDQGPGDGP